AIELDEPTPIAAAPARRSDEGGNGKRAPAAALPKSALAPVSIRSERIAPEAAPEPQNPVTTTPEPTMKPVAPSRPVLAGDTKQSENKPGVAAGVALRAFDLEQARDRQSQWQAVERSIWDLSPKSALLDARPPMSWATETCIAIDATGRLNVWTLY